MKTGTKKAWKITAFVLLGLIAAVILAAVAYVLYVVIEYDRIEDNLVLSVENPIDGKYLEIGESYTAVTYNIGFGAYSPDFSFFMDSGEMLDGTVVTGKYGKAIDKEHVLKDIAGSVNVLKESKADFILVQEVDTDADRSYHVDQYAALKEALSGYSSTFAVNFHSAYLMYPLNDHHGKSTAGIATFSAYGITESVRRSYPVDDGFAKFFDLDRCFSVNRIAVEGGKELVLINSHMSAYDEGGLIREQQLALLKQFIEAEYADGNYVIVGGDFNHELADSLGTFPTRQKTPTWAYPLTTEMLGDNFRVVASKEGTGTCRAAEIPYEKGVNYLTVLDGFIVSDNVETVSITNVDTDFAYSDHNPVKFVFTLKG